MSAWTSASALSPIPQALDASRPARGRRPLGTQAAASPAAVQAPEKPCATRLATCFSACVLALAILGLAGCVRETVGGLPAPASTLERVQAQLDLARGHLQSRNWSRAHPPLLRALELDPGSVEARMLLGLSYEQQNEPQLAESQYREALALEPTHAQTLNNYGAFLYGQGRFQEALVPLRKLVQRPDYQLRAQAYENLGLTELRLGHGKAAQQAFRRALELGVGQPRSSLELADLLLAEGDYEGAERHYRDFAATAGHAVRSLCLGLRLALARGDAQNAERRAQALKSRFSEAVGRCLAGADEAPSPAPSGKQTAGPTQRRN